VIELQYGLHLARSFTTFLFGFAQTHLWNRG
jgi:hypothetical protein